MVSFLVSLVLSSEHYAVYHVSLAVDSFAYSFSYRVNLVYSVSSKIERDFSRDFSSTTKRLLRDVSLSAKEINSMEIRSL